MESWDRRFSKEYIETFYSLPPPFFSFLFFSCLTFYNPGTAISDNTNLPHHGKLSKERRERKHELENTLKEWVIFFIFILTRYEALGN